MRAKSRFFALAVMLFPMLLTGCSYQYKCGVTFGTSSCTGSGGGLGGGGNGGGGTGTFAALAYNINQSGNMDGYALNIDGSTSTFENIPSFNAPAVPSLDFGAGVVIAQNKFVYAAFPISELLYAWSIDPTTGNLTNLTGSPFAAPYLINSPAISTGVNLNLVLTNRAGTLLFIADTTDNQIQVFQIDSAGGLTPAPGSPFSTVGVISPWNLALDGLGKYLYVTQGLEGQGNAVAAYVVDQTTGALSLVPGSPFPFNMWQMQGEPTGQFMVATSGNVASITGTDDPNLYVFSIQQSGANAGALTAAVGSPFATVNPPLNLATQPNASNGEFVYAFGLNSFGFNSAEGYQLDATTGALNALSGSPFTSLTATPWAQFTNSGAYLMVRGDFLMAVFNVDSAGNLTEPTTPLVISSDSYWGAADAQ